MSTEVSSCWYFNNHITLYLRNISTLFTQSKLVHIEFTLNLHRVKRSEIHFNILAKLAMNMIAIILTLTNLARQARYNSKSLISVNNGIVNYRLTLKHHVRVELVEACTLEYCRVRNAQSLWQSIHSAE